MIKRIKTLDGSSANTKSLYPEEQTVKQLQKGKISYNYGNNIQKNYIEVTIDNVENTGHLILKEEFETAFKELKYNNTTGIDNVSEEMLKVLEGKEIKHCLK